MSRLVRSWGQGYKTVPSLPGWAVPLAHCVFLASPRLIILWHGGYHMVGTQLRFNELSWITLSSWTHKPKSTLACPRKHNTKANHLATCQRGLVLCDHRSAKHRVGKVFQSTNSTPSCACYNGNREFLHSVRSFLCPNDFQTFKK